MTWKKMFETIFAKVRILVEIEDKESAFVNGLLYYFKVCGVMPLSFVGNVINNENIKQYVFSESYLGISYNLILICGIILFSYFSFSTCDLSSLNEKYQLEYYFGFVLYKIIVVCITLMLIIYCIEYKKFFALCKAIQKITTTVKSEDRNNTFKLPIVKVLCIIILCVVISLGSLVLSNIISTVCPLVLNSVLICRLIQNALIFQYSAILKLAEHLFKILNANLLYLFSLDSTNNVNIIFESKARKATLCRLKASYSLLTNLCEELSDFFSLPMVFCLLSVFGTLLGSTYSMSLPLFLKVSHVNSWTFYISIFYFSQCLFPLLTLTYNISALIRESKKTSKIISNHLKVTRNPDINEKLHQFSIDLLHTNVKFTVFDWFSLDGTLLMSTAGIITTYLVIVIEFQMQ